MKICWNCNKEIPDQGDYCPYCRSAVSDEAVNGMDSLHDHGPDQIVPGMVVNERYEVRREIGGGGMGIVYLAHDRTMDREVAY